MLPSRRVIALILLALSACGIFLVACGVFHFPPGTGIDVLWLTALTVLPGTLAVLILRQIFSLELEAHEILSLGTAVGFGFPPILLGALHFFGIQHVETVYYILRVSLTVTVLILMVLRKLRLGFEGQLRAINDLLIFAIGALLFLSAYNLVQFHYGPDGSIVTRNLFGVDLPFLAGEIHGIQDFGSLRDLHQFAQPWHYHDWTYQILALLPRERTLPDLAFAAPLVGYALLAFSVFAFVKRLTSNTYVAYVSAALWFLTSEIGRTEMELYSLSPSYVFGSIILLNILLLLDHRTKIDIRTSQGNRERWLYFSLSLYFLIELSQTKISSFLVLAAGIGCLGLLSLVRKKQLGVELLVVVAISFTLLILENLRSNPYMPSSDFLIGAPLLGYGNHLAKLLHLSTAALNPVSQGLHINWRNLLIIPYFIFHVLRFSITGPKVPSALIILLVFRKSLWQNSNELFTLLLLVLPLGLLLPVLYSPSWYALALSFYAPLVSVQAVFLIVAFAFGIYRHESPPRIKNTAIGFIALLFVFGIAFETHSILDENSSKPDIVPAALVQAMTFLGSHSNNAALLATDRYDLDSTHDESYYWYSALSGRTVVSEGAKYGSLLAAVADTDSEKGLHPVRAAKMVLFERRRLLDTIYQSSDSTNVLHAIDRLGISYILEDSSKSMMPAGLGSKAVLEFERPPYRIFKLK